MSYNDVASYTVTVFVIALAPGPVALMLVARSASKDVIGALGFGTGFALGGVAIIAVVCFGLGTWITTEPDVFAYSKYAMMAYILWLARGVWKGSMALDCNHTAAKRSVLPSLGAGMFTCFVSPYMMVLFPLVLPGLTDITTIELFEFSFLAALTFGALLAGSAVIIAFAAQISRLITSPRGMLMLRRGLSSMLVLGGGWMAFA